MMSRLKPFLILGIFLLSLSQASSATLSEAALSDIIVRRMGATTQVVLVSDVPFLYRDFALKEPDRILLDCTGLLSLLPRRSFPAVERGGVVGIDLSRFEKSNLLRVAIRLNGSIPHTTFSEQNNLIISLATGDEDSFKEWKASDVPSASLSQQGPSPTPHSSPPLAAPSLAPPSPPAVMPAREQLISMDLEDADIVTVLRALADYSGRDIVAGPEVTGKVSMRLHSVPWKRALELIVKTAGYAYIEEDKVIRVTTAAKLAKERAELAMAEALVHRVYKLEFAVPGEVVATLNKILSTRGSIEIDVRTNSIVVNDIVSAQEKIAKMVTLLDSPTPQVEIEAKVVDIDYSASRALGINWTVVGLRSRTYNVEGDVQIEKPGERIAGFGTFNIGTVRSFAELDLTLRALEDEGKSETIANPRVTVVNNRKASIVGGKKFSLTVLDQRGNPITQLYTVGTKLDVIPNINSLDEVTMDIHSELSEVDEATVATGRPVMTTSEADTRQLVKDGQTVVLGGFIREKRSTSMSGVPILRSIPLLGALFKETATTYAKREVLIFLTPHIIPKTS